MQETTEHGTVHLDPYLILIYSKVWSEATRMTTVTRTGIQSPQDNENYTQCKFCGALLPIDELEKHMTTEMCNNSPQNRGAQD
jgi:hypothetical protein